LLTDDFLHAANRFAASATRAGIRVCALAAHGQTAAMADAAITTDIHQALDIHADFGAQRALDFIIRADDLTNLRDIFIRQIFDSNIRVDFGLFENDSRIVAPDTENIGQRHFDTLLAWQVDTCNTRHCLPP
jgi:hypothetical protein